MPDAVVQPVDIPNRALFKAAEVCDLAKLQPYVLRSWESEFPQLGVAKAAGAPRVYRRADVEQVLRIKHLLLVEGLTLAGARRKIEEEAALVAPDVPVIDELIGQSARERLTEVKRGLKSILAMLGGSGSQEEFRLEAPTEAPRRETGRNGKQALPVRRASTSRTKAESKHDSTRAPQARRKTSR